MKRISIERVAGRTIYLVWRGDYPIAQCRTLADAVRRQRMEDAA